MQAPEALQRVIDLVDHITAPPGSELRNIVRSEKDREDDNVAIAICQAMLNMMIPVTRYRAFVEVDEHQPKRTKEQEKRAVHKEFIISGINMDQIIAGLVGITNIPTACKISVWEQRKTGADMISGYQGESKCQQYRIWLDSLKGLEAAPTLN